MNSGVVVAWLVFAAHAQALTDFPSHKPTERDYRALQCVTEKLVSPLQLLSECAEEARAQPYVPHRCTDHWDHMIAYNAAFCACIAGEGAYYSDHLNRCVVVNGKAHDIDAPLSPRMDAARAAVERQYSAKLRELGLEAYLPPPRTESPHDVELRRRERIRVFRETDAPSLLTCVWVSVALTTVLYGAVRLCIAAQVGWAHALVDRRLCSCTSNHAHV